jgi:hypothetical protein
MTVSVSKATVQVQCLPYFPSIGRYLIAHDSCRAARVSQGSQETNLEASTGARKGPPETPNRARLAWLPFENYRTAAAGTQSRCRELVVSPVFCSCSTSYLLPPSYLIYPHPSTSRLRLYLQTSVHRCLPLLTPTKLTKKLEKARKTRPFIDSLVEGSRPQHTPPTRTLPPTHRPHFTSLHLISLHSNSSHSRARSPAAIARSRD